MIIKGEKLLTRLKPRTLAGLPSAVGLRTGTSFAVTDYGGNVAVAVNGQWRFELPFRTTWAGRPAVGLVPAGTELQVTDINNQKFISDGTVWRPAQGRALLKMLCQPLAAPLAVFTGGTAGLFALPGGPVKIPAGLIPPNSKIVVSASYRRTTAVVALNTLIYLGTTATNGDIGVLSQSIAATANQDAVGCGVVRFGSSKTTLTTSNWISDYNTASATAVATDRSTNINTDADMYVTLGVSGANVADSVALISVSVHLEA